MIRNCKICNKEFDTKISKMKLVCSKECSIFNKRNLSKAYVKNNKVKVSEKNRLYKIEYRQKRKKEIRENRNKWISNNREHFLKLRKNTILKHRFGITSADYDKLMLDQNNVCAICKKEESAIEKQTGKIKRLAVDHCHTSKKVRGLLCTNCNLAIGNMKDSIDNLLSAVEYLKKSRQ